MKTRFLRRAMRMNQKPVAYYVDATNGSDSNTGRTPASAWQTETNINGGTFLPGNQILLKRGTQLREQIILPSSGAAGNQIKIGAYGSGARPIISGADIITGWAAYGAGAGSTWQSALATETFLVFMDDVRLTEGVVDRDNLDDHEWIWVGNVLYVRDDTGDPDGSGVLIEAAQRDPIEFLFPGRDYITLADLHLMKSNGMGVKAWESNTCSLLNCTIEQTTNQGFWIRDAGNGSPNLRIENSLFDTCGSSQQAAIYGMGNNIRIRNTIVQNSPCKAVEFRDVALKQSENFLVEYCQFLNCGGTGQEQAGVSPNGANSIGTNNYAHSGVIRYSLFQDLAGRGIDGFFRNCQIYYNIFDNIDAGAAGSGIAMDINGPGNEIYNNLIWRPEAIGLLFGNDHLAPDVQSTARNNIVASDAVLNTAISVINDVDVNPILSNNTYYPNGTGAANYSWKGAVFTFANWVAQSSESDSQEINPVFVNGAGGDFHLQVGSPCRNVGADVSLPRDYGGVTVPQETNPAIGAYEYVA